MKSETEDKNILSSNVVTIVIVSAVAVFAVIIVIIIIACVVRKNKLRQMRTMPQPISFDDVRYVLCLEDFYAAKHQNIAST